MLDTIPIWVQSYVGLPYLCGGRTKENGLDCYGLVRLVLSERAKLTITNYSSDDVNTHQETAEHIRTGEKDWAPVEPPYRCFDVALMKTIVRHNDQVKNLPVHIGIFVSSSQVLHSEIVGGSSVLSKLDRLSKRLVCVYRYHKDLRGCA